MDELCISKKHNKWLWTAVSRQTGQILAWVIGDRKWNMLEKLWARLPRSWHRRLVYTDGYGAYGSFFWAWQHRVCQKFYGGTCTVEGVNNSLRHRCGLLVRRHSGPRCGVNLETRVALAVEAHNRACQDRWPQRVKKATQSRQ
ncbi:IS1 family transposase [Armatimonas sp.]|uniref:IS1 family transposase n=1 Tax=Armatimonas sp. TaxID=1872638 RepID=UPI0034D96866